MSQPDFAAARRYALARLVDELPTGLTYHTPSHTIDEVVPAAERLAYGEDVQGEDLLLLLTAAYMHDLGFIERYADNEEIAVRIARQVLPAFGYTPGQADVVAGIIAATRLPQAPKDLLQQIMADADLDVLGRADFLERNRALRAELEAMTGQAPGDRIWFAGQLAFLQSHRYFTATAQALNNPGKQRNIALLLAASGCA